jgi:hypothetical protein
VQGSDPLVKAGDLLFEAREIFSSLGGLRRWK